MKLEQCWLHYIKAEELIQQGHWPEAHYLYSDVLSHLPVHIQNAVNCERTRPCQLRCMLDGFRNACINQSEILNNLGRKEEAFTLLSHTYSYFQFLALESHVIVNTINPVLHNHSEDLFRYISAFCAAQRNADWMQELANVQKSHHHFHQLQHSVSFEQSRLLN